MNAFYEHHQDSISFHYRCFDRMLLNATIQPFQQPERVMGFFWSYRQIYPVSRQVLRDIATQYHHWVQYCSRQSGAPILDAPEEERREHFVTPYYRGAQPDQIVAILKAREPARILVSIGKSATEQGHLLYKRRWVDQYNFYIHDRAWGRMFVRLCPYFPFPARVYLNQHYWLAQPLRSGASVSSPAPTLSYAVVTPSSFSNWPIPCNLRTSPAAPRNGSLTGSPSLPPANGARPGSNTVCSSLRSSTVTTSSSGVGLPWTVGESVSSMPIDASATPIH
jgi:transposase